MAGFLRRHSVLKSALIIAGPTSAGKTGIAIDVAKQFGAVVVSADAMQVYRGMNVGTGKASASEQQGVLHFGLDLVNPDQAFDAADFIRIADVVIASHARVIVAGGTSLYHRALVRGLVATPPVDRELRAQLEQMPDAHRALAKVDPDLAERLHPNDRLRIVRGLEVFHATGQQLSALQAIHATQPDRIKSRGVWVDRDDLYERIDARVHGMIDVGYLSEVQSLLDAGYARSLKPMQSLGYRHLAAHLIDGLPLDEAIRLTQRDTRHFSRKQRNWMRVLKFNKHTDDAYDAARRAAEALWG